MTNKDKTNIWPDMKSHDKDMTKQHLTKRERERKREQERELEREREREREREPGWAWCSVAEHKRQPGRTAFQPVRPGVPKLARAL